MCDCGKQNDRIYDDEPTPDRGMQAQTPARRAVDQLSEEIARLESNISDIESRLESVMSDDQSMPATKEAEEDRCSGRSNHVMSIDSERRRVSLLTYRMLSILRRLEA